MPNCVTHRHAHKGFILIQVLIYGAVMALLVLNGWEHLQLSYKQLSHLAMREEVFSKVEIALRAVETQLLQMEQKPCVQPRQSAHYFYNKTGEWWRANVGCKYNQHGIELRYAIEVLDSYPCMQAVQIAAPGVTFYRITMGSVSEALVNVSMQSIIAVPQFMEAECAHLLEIKAGQQSWIELTAGVE